MKYGKNYIKRWTMMLAFSLSHGSAIGIWAQEVGSHVKHSEGWGDFSHDAQQMVAVFNAFEALRARIRKPSGRIFPFVSAPHASQCINQGVFRSRKFVDMVGQHGGHEFVHGAFQRSPS
jgi:hypothetical protein